MTTPVCPFELVLNVEQPHTNNHYGPGILITAGAGVPPFVAITRQLASIEKLDSNSLIYFDKTPADVICEKELRHYFGSRCILTCTQKSALGYENRRITVEFLKEKIQDFTQRLYVCGPS